MFLWQDMSSISVFVLGREIRMIDVSPCIDQLFDRIKQRIRDEEGIPTRFMAVQTGLDDTYFVGLHSFKRIQNMDGDLLTEVKDLLPLAKAWFAKRELATVMPLDGDMWSSDELHVQTYVALRQWCYENDYKVGNDRVYGPGGPGGPADGPPARPCPPCPEGPGDDRRAPLIAHDGPPRAKARPRSRTAPPAKARPPATAKAKAKQSPAPQAKQSPAPQAKRRLASRAR